MSRMGKSVAEHDREVERRRDLYEMAERSLHGNKGDEYVPLTEEERESLEEQIEDLDNQISCLRQLQLQDVGKVVENQKPLSDEEFTSYLQRFNDMTKELQGYTDFLLKNGVKINTHNLTELPTPSILTKENILDVIRTVREDNWKDSCCGTNYIVEDICNEVATGLLTLLEGVILPKYRLGNTVWYLNDSDVPIPFNVASITLRSNTVIYSNIYIEKQEWQLFDSKEYALNSVR